MRNAGPTSWCHPSQHLGPYRRWLITTVDRLILCQDEQAAADAPGVPRP